MIAILLYVNEQGTIEEIPPESINPTGEWLKTRMVKIVNVEGEFVAILQMVTR